ncbi:hypothetical protein PIB30_049055, partial [Stylosanthes scabra]|nr:hypothetical protein [Stylosanthes scabra]
MECFITWQLELENSGLFDRKPILNSCLNETNEPKSNRFEGYMLVLKCYEDRLEL